MYPRRIVQRALEEGLDMIAVTDHNAAGNAEAVIRAAAGTGLTVFPGMEISSEEDVHILGIFETMAAIEPVVEAVAGNLAGPGTKTDFIQDQILVDEKDEVAGFNSQFLSGSALLSVFDIVELIRGRGGLAVASHFDRESFSLISQLGFLPHDLKLDALESTGRAESAAALSAALPRVAFSDAHCAGEIGRRSTDFLLAAPRISEIRMALAGAGGRKILLS
jgi:3',5'-nucleoside bisphosphate phosphatase